MSNEFGMNSNCPNLNDVFPYRNPDGSPSFWHYQKDVIVSADQPFGPYFDASLVWGPVTGRMFYVGWRYKIK